MIASNLSPQKVFLFTNYFYFFLKFYSLPLLVGLISVQVVKGQVATVKWGLTVNSSPANSGNITGLSQIGGAGIGTMSYTSNGVSSTKWATPGLDINNYYQFAVSPNSGYDLTITNITTTNSLSSLTATGQIQYSYSSSFNSPVNLNGTFALSNASTTTSFNALSVIVPNAQTLYVRIFVYNDIDDKITGSQTIRCKDFTISGITSKACTPNTISGLAPTNTRTLGNPDYFLNATAISDSITYSSSNPLVAAVTSGGRVTIVGEGTATITAFAAANGAYCAGSATQTLTVKPIANPTTFTATASSFNQINLFAIANAATNNIVVVYNATSSFTTPLNGNIAPSEGKSFADGIVLYNGTANGLHNHIGVIANSQYYYKIFSYDANNYYSSGLIANAVTPVFASDIATTAMSNITNITGSSGGTITSVGNAALITARGVVYGTVASPTFANSATTNGTGTGEFVASLTALNAQTLYYVRAYATNAAGTTYAASEVSFRTLSNPPTAQPTSISVTSSTTTGASILLTGNATFPAMGAVKAGYLLIYSTSIPALVASPNGVAPVNAISVGSQVAITEMNAPNAPSVTGTLMTALLPKTTYNILIVPYTWDGANTNTYNYYVTNAKTTSFTTLVSIPYSNDFENNVSEWLLGSTSPNGWYIGNATNNGGTKAMYISTIANAGSNNSYGLAPGGTISMDASIRVDLTNVTAASLAFDWRCVGEIGFDYGEVYINIGSADILISNPKEFHSSSVFANRKISLTAYVGNIATIKFRWINDNSNTFTMPFAVDNVAITEGDVPLVATTTISAIAINSATTGGSVTNDGGSLVTAKGVVYGTKPLPTLSNNVISTNGGIGAFVSNVTGLLDNTTYYVRAYATNANGTSYGSGLNFTTNSVGQPIMGATTSITSSGFTANWGVVTGANLGYQLEVSTSTNFSNGTILSEGFEGATFPPTGWTNASWSRSINAGDVKSGNAAATASSANGTLTTPAVAYPTAITFYLGRTNNATAKTLTVEVSITSQFTDFATVATYDHTNVPVSTYNQYTINLSAYASEPIVYIRFVKSSSTLSLWRLDDVIVSNVSTLVSGYNPKIIPEQASNSLPVTGLNANTTYYYRLNALANNSTSFSASSVAVNTYKATSTADHRSKAIGAFSDVANWEYNHTGNAYIDAIQLPISTNNITITHPMTLDIDYTVASGKTFTLGNGGSLIVAPSSTLTIAGNADFGGQSVTLQSTSITNGGAIGTITGSLTGASNVTIQRYTQAQRGYRTIANPFNSPQALSQLTNTIRITGLSSNNGTYGTTTGSPSAFYYDPTQLAGTSSVLQPITDATSTANWGVGKALYVFVRGSGTQGSAGPGSSNYGGTISPVTLSMSGATINQGDVPVNLTYGSGTSDHYNLIGNPYPCPVNLKGITTVGTFSTVYVYNPIKNIGASNQFSISGGFDQYNNNGTTDIIIPSLGGFYVLATANGQSITFKESNKITSITPNVTVFGGGTPTPRIRLAITTANGNVDDLQFGFNANATALASDLYDAPKLSNSLFDFYSLSSDNKRLAIDYRSSTTMDSIIPLGITTSVPGNYSINLSELSGLPNTKLVLMDKKLNTVTPLAKVGDSYSFSITTDSSSFGNQRFQLGLSQNVVLPVQLVDITAQLQTNKTVAVSWTSATELNLAYYNVQRSTDGSNFSTVGKVAATGAGNYTYNDDLSTISNLPSTVYYRLQSVDKDASSAYSKVVSCQLSNVTKPALSIYPNPVQATLYAQVTVTKAGPIDITVTDMQGKLLSKQIAQVAAGTTAVSVNTASLAGGNYVLVIKGTDGIQKQQFVKE